ncbi:MAG: cation transporter [Candidatus Abyssubacteria bacterium]|nr:cation transporter [Candidatus Abyssubacteria bacterium]
MSPQNSFAQAKKVLVGVLALNWLVSAAKIIVGYTINSVSMIADGFHSLLDGASNVIGLVGLTIASKESDEAHPYGHKKYETFTAVGISLLLFITCFEVLELAVRRWFQPRTIEVSAFSFGVMIVTLSINVLVMRYERKKGHELFSDVLIADSAHTKSDIYVSLSVIATLVLVWLGFPHIDSVVAVGIALAIGRAGFQIMKRSSAVLCDTMVIDRARIETVCSGIEGIKKCHKIRTRGREDDINIDLHVVVDQEMHVHDAHDISHELQKRLKEQIPGVTDVQIHIEPL